MLKSAEIKIFVNIPHIFAVIIGYYFSLISIAFIGKLWYYIHAIGKF